MFLIVLKWVYESISQIYIISLIANIRLKKRKYKKNNRNTYSECFIVGEQKIISMSSAWIVND